MKTSSVPIPYIPHNRILQYKISVEYIGNAIQRYVFLFAYSHIRVISILSKKCLKMNPIKIVEKYENDLSIVVVRKVLIGLRLSLSLKSTHTFVYFKT